MPEPSYNLSKQSNDPSHPTGWTTLKKGVSLAAAKQIAASREKLTPWAFSDKNPNRVYHLIEPA